MSRFRNYTKKWIERESAPAKKRRAIRALALLKKTYPQATIALRFSNDIQLLVAVILSAQCTDKKVNEVTEKLFQRYATVDDFADAVQHELERMIFQTGFYRAKARHIIAAARKIRDEFGGNIPRTMEEITTLPGVARKTGNIVLGNAYGVTSGIAVDTHVSRIAQRLGFTRSDNPQAIERDLMSLIPKKDWLRATYYVIEHGRAICSAQKRKCELCPLRAICPSALPNQVKKGSR